MVLDAGRVACETRGRAGRSRPERVAGAGGVRGGQLEVSRVDWAKMRCRVIDPSSTVYGLSNTLFRLWHEMVYWVTREETHGRVCRVRVAGERRTIEWASGRESSGLKAFPHALSWLVSHVDSLVDVGLLVESDGWLHIAKWLEWQADQERAIAYRGKDRDRKRAARSGGTSQQTVWEDNPGVVQPDEARRVKSKEESTALSSLRGEGGSSAPPIEEAALRDRDKPAATASSNGRAMPDLAPWLDDAPGIRKHVRDTVSVWRLTGERRLLVDELSEDWITHEEATHLRGLIAGETSHAGAGKPTPDTTSAVDEPLSQALSPDISRESDMGSRA